MVVTAATSAVSRTWKETLNSRTLLYIDWCMYCACTGLCTLHGKTATLKIHSQIMSVYMLTKECLPVYCRCGVFEKSVWFLIGILSFEGTLKADIENTYRQPADYNGTNEQRHILCRHPDNTLWCIPTGIHEN